MHVDAWLDVEWTQIKEKGHLRWVLLYQLRQIALRKAWVKLDEAQKEIEEVQKTCDPPFAYHAVMFYGHPTISCYVCNASVGSNWEGRFVEPPV